MTTAELITEMRCYAAENFYVDSWDCLLRWTDAEVAVAIQGATTRRGAIAKAWKVIRDIDARRARSVELTIRYGAKPARPVSLMQFLAKHGGVAPHPELTILGGNPFIGGHGPLVRRTGAELDEARRMAVEAGYLYDTPWQGGVASSTVNDLLDALADEARGLKCYPNGEMGEDPASAYDPNTEGESYEDVPF